MKKVSLEKQIAGIINNGHVSNSKTIHRYGEETEVRAIQEGNFKCTMPMVYMKDRLAYARRLSRKKPERFPVPNSQKILAFLSAHREVIPYYMKMAGKKNSNWFKQQISLNFPDEAETILKDAIYGNKSDMQYAIATMPRAWKKYADRDIDIRRKVVIREFKDTGDIIALFPGMPWSTDSRMVTSYMRFDGHGGADYQSVIPISRPASKDECVKMKSYLTSLGYENLIVVGRKNYNNYLH